MLSKADTITLTYKNVTRTIREWAKILNVEYQLLLARANKKWTAA